MKNKMFALEDENAVAMVSDEPMPDAMEMESDNEEIDHCAEVTSDISLKMQEGFETVDVLDKMETIVENSIDSGEGMDETSAEVVRVTLESIRIRLGMPPMSTKAFATEAFKTPASRVAASKVALEAGIVQTLVNIWKGLLHHLKRIKDNVADFFRSYKSVYKKYLAQLTESEKKFKEMPKDATMKSETLSDKSLARQLTIDGFTADADTALKLVDVTSKAMMNGVAASEEYVNAVSSIQKKVISGDKDLKSCFDTLKKLETKLLAGLPESKKANTVFDMTKTYGPVLGYKFLTLGTEVIADGAGGTYEYWIVNNAHGETSAKQLTAIPAKKMAEVIKATRKFGEDSLTSLGKNFDAYAAITSIERSIARTMDWVAFGKAKNAEEKDQKEYAKAVSKMISSIAAISVYVYLDMPYNTFRGYRAMVRYVGLSVNNLKAPEAPSAA